MVEPVKAVVSIEVAQFTSRCTSRCQALNVIEGAEITSGCQALNVIAARHRHIEGLAPGGEEPGDSLRADEPRCREKRANTWDRASVAHVWCAAHIKGLAPGVKAQAKERETPWN
jgi:hypothetical protein